LHEEQPASEQPALPGQKPHQDIPTVGEWIIAAVGLVLVVSTIGFLLLQALRDNAAPPHITVVPESVDRTRNAYLVTIRIMNRGEATAASSKVEGELSNGAASVETSAVTIDYVPLRSQRRAGLYFQNDPRRFKLRLRPKGYRHP